MWGDPHITVGRRIERPTQCRMAMGWSQAERLSSKGGVIDLLRFEFRVFALCVVAFLRGRGPRNADSTTENAKTRNARRNVKSGSSQCSCRVEYLDGQLAFAAMTATCLPASPARCEKNLSLSHLVHEELT